MPIVQLTDIVFSDSFTGDGVTAPLDIKPIYFSSKFSGTGLTQADPIDILFSQTSDPKVLPFSEKSANYTVTLNDCVINCITNSFTVTLPSASTVPSGRYFKIKNSTVGTSITVKSAVATQTIDDVTAKVLTNRTTLTVLSTGAKYIII